MTSHRCKPKNILLNFVAAKGAKNVFKNKNIPKKLQLRLKNTIDKTLTYASET